MSIIPENVHKKGGEKIKTMKTGTKIIICTIAAILALVFAAFTYDSFKPSGTVYAAVIETPQIFVLGEWNGNIAVFEGTDTKNPVSITDIELRTLRESDRALIRAGLVAASRAELLELLEDLGS